MSMQRHALIDLYVPATLATCEEVAQAARRAALDAVVYVVDSPEELPTHDEVAAANADGVRVWPACVANGPGYRVAVLLPDWDAPSAYDLLQATGDLGLVQAAVAEMGGCAIPVCPRQAPEGEVLRQVASMPVEPPIGVIALVADGSALGRDLDIEDAGAAQRRVLGGTGPFGQLEQIGRFATLLPADPADVQDIIRRLNQGFGIAVERARDGAARGEGAFEGGEDEEGGRRRRRRRRGGREGDERRGGGGEGQAQAAAESAREGERGRGPRREGGGGRGPRREGGGERREGGGERREGGGERRNGGGGRGRGGRGGGRGREGGGGRGREGGGGQGRSRRSRD